MKFRTYSFSRNLLIVTAFALAWPLSQMFVSDAYAEDVAEHRIINKKLKGSYGFLAQAYFGVKWDQANNETHSALAMRAGVMKFDGRGGCTIHSMANKAGLAAAVTQDTDQCTYEVYADGTGKLTAFLGGPKENPNSFTFDAFFVLVKEGQEFMFTRLEGTNNPSDAGGATLAFGLAKKQ